MSKNYFLKFPSLLKFLKPLPTADTNRPKLNSTTTPKLTVDKDFTTSTEKKASLQHCIKAIAVWVHTRTVFAFIKYLAIRKVSAFYPLQLLYLTVVSVREKSGQSGGLGVARDGVRNLLVEDWRCWVEGGIFRSYLSLEKIKNKK